jgi:hypothetical protein
MKTKTALVMSLIAASMAIALASVIAPIAVADKSSGSNGLETADKKIHENTDSTPEHLSQQDLNFHVGTCQGGHTTQALNDIAGGCTLPSPSEFHSPQH